MKKFAVFSFPDENNVMHTVPSCWLLGNNSVKWPTSGSPTSLIIKCIDIVNDEWEARNIKIYSMASKCSFSSLLNF